MKILKFGFSLIFVGLFIGCGNTYQPTTPEYCYSNNLYPRIYSSFAVYCVNDIELSGDFRNIDFNEYGYNKFGYN